MKHSPRKFRHRLFVLGWFLVINALLLLVAMVDGRGAEVALRDVGILYAALGVFVWRLLGCVLLAVLLGIPGFLLALWLVPPCDCHRQRTGRQGTLPRRQP